MRRILGQMVTKNEADRYLDASLEWHTGIFDDIHVYDDASDDDTVKLARGRGCEVSERPLNVPSFVEHEGRFRQAAWEAFQDRLRPGPEDWIFAIDADEFVVTRDDERDELHLVCGEAERAGAVAVLTRIPEVFDVEMQESILTKPKIRVDGYWAQIIGSRLFHYQPGGSIAPKPMGSGSEPTYVQGGGMIQAPGLWLMHYGYADPADRQAKFDRYSGRTGHANAHVMSILREPALVPWDGPAIFVRRGRA